MSKSGLSAIHVDFVFFFREDLIGKLAHEATTNAFANHGSWPHRMAYVFVHSMGVTMMRVIVSMRVAMAMIVTVCMMMRVIMPMAVISM